MSDAIRLTELPRANLRLIDDTRPPAWERQGGESSLAYAGFCCYRDLGPTRTLRIAYEAFLVENPMGNGRKSARNQNGQAEGIGGSKGFPTSWGTWSSHYDWRERAEAYDTYLDQIALQRRTEQQNELIEAYRVRTLEMGLAKSSTAARFFNIVNQKLTMMEKTDAEALRQLERRKAEETKAALEGKPAPSWKGKLTIQFVPLDDYRLLSQVMRNAAMVGESGQESEAEAVGVTGIQRMIEEQQSRGEEM